MTNAINSTGSTIGSAKTPVVSGHLTSVKTANADAASSTGALSFRSPHIIQDPTVGVITQYLNVNGSEVVSQTPDAITVAYLRNGLERDGSRKSSTTTV